MFVSEHILVDGTFFYPSGFIQTIILLYYDIIVFKFIPGIFILINNKSQFGYEQPFRYIKENMDKYANMNKEICKWKTFTSDFERALINSFNNVFNTNNDLKHIGCYFHYLKNCRLRLVQEGYNSEAHKADYERIMDFVLSLPFNHNINNNITKRIKDFSKHKKHYNFFKIYFENQWIEFFKNKSLCLNNILLSIEQTMLWRIIIVNSKSMMEWNQI